MGRAEAEALYERMEARGVRLVLEGDALRVSAPKGLLDERLRAELTANKPQLLELLRARAPLVPHRTPRDGRLPVSAAQQRLWFLNQVDPGNAAYNIAGAVRLLGRLDRAAFDRALADLIDRHEALRTRISERDGSPWLEISDAARARVDWLDLSGEPPAEAEARVQRLANELGRSAFDMQRGPLSRLQILRLADDHHVLASSTHHVISDGWSLSLLLSEVFALYQAHAAGRAPALAPLTLGPVDHAAWERELIATHRFAPSLAFWKQALHGAPAALELPTDRTRPAKPGLQGRRLARFIDLRLIDRVKVRAQQQGATLFMALMTNWQAVLHRYSGQDDIVVGTPLANRDRPEFEGIIGCLINNVVVRGRLDDNPTLAEFLDQIRERSLQAFEHGRVPFDLVVEHVNPPRSTSHAPIFQVLFTHMNFPSGIPPTAGLTLSPVILEPQASRFDLACEMSVDLFGEHANQQRVTYEFSRDLFDDATIAQLHDHFAQMLTAFADDASQRILDVPLTLSADDVATLDAIAVSIDHDRGLCVHQWFESQVAATPDRPAVTAGGRTFSYADVDRQANRLARLLLAHGVERGDSVAFCLDRTVDIPVAMAAVLKAGAAYVPLDPTHPQDRLRYIVADSEARCVLTLRAFAPLFADDATPLLFIDALHAELGRLDAASPAVEVAADALAYVLYTSGSTGRPKGVEVEHRNVVAFLRAMAREPGMSRDDVLLAVTTPAFDIAGLEIWLPLVCGARLVMASRSDVIDGARLGTLLAAHDVTVMQATPATWRLMLDAGWNGAARLTALCGGEAMPRDLATRLLGRVGTLWNMYGPTETTIWSTVSRVAHAAGPISIGLPIANTVVRVVDARGQQTPPGVVGELCIGGEGVARGYRKRAELTAEKFVELEPLPGRRERLYRTGDLARFRRDGQLEFIGRRDHQVKVRGYRIELGEIEAVLAAQHDVRQCVVIVREDLPGDQRLTAYLTMQPGARFDADAAKLGLRERLPDYMIPAAFVVLDVLPLTPNGKVDRAALPRPLVAAPTGVERADDLMNAVQRRVAAVWSDVLHVERVGLHDNFFDIGGHSLLLVKLHAQLKATFAVELPLVELFQRTTVVAQAERMSSPTAPSDALERARARAARITHA